MTAVKCLKALQEYLQKEVADNILLMKESLTTSEPEYVNPYVELISLPHKNFTPVNFQVPYILIGLADGFDGAEEHSLEIRIQIATYGGKLMFKETANLPDSSGYIDLLNLIERIKSKLVNVAVIPNGGVINKPIRYGVYNEEITYPYWYGFVSFTMQIPVTQRQMLEF